MWDLDLKEGCRIDFAKRLPMSERLENKKSELAALKTQARDHDAEACTSPTAKDNGDIEMTASSLAARTVTASTTGAVIEVGDTTSNEVSIELPGRPSNHNNSITATESLPGRPSKIIAASHENQYASQAHLQPGASGQFNDHYDNTLVSTPFDEQETHVNDRTAVMNNTTTNNSKKNDDDVVLNAVTDLKIQFILKLCTAQMACGQCTVDAELHASNAAIALDLPVPTLDLGPRVMHAAFVQPEDKLNTYNFLGTSRDIILCKLMDITWIAKLVVLQGDSYTTREDIEALMAIVDDVMAEPLPYGWLVQDILFVALCTLATIAAFFGSYQDMLIVFIISLFILAIQKVTKRYPSVLGPIHLVLVCACSSLITALAYSIAHNNEWWDASEQMCNVPIIYLSPLLVYLPGSELIYGAYELQMGHMVVGASRLVHALVKCMVMAAGLTIGWQFTGYNFVNRIGFEYDGNTTIPDGIKASYVPSNKCPPFSKAWNIGPWWLVFVLWNLALLIPCLGGLQVRVRDMPSTYSIAYVSLVLFGALNFQLGINNVSSFLVNIIGLFVATNLACLKEYITGIPAVSSIVPVLLVLAPGSVVVLQILTLMQVNDNVVGAEAQINNGGGDISAYLWLLGVTYSLGMYLALAIWKPILLKREVGTGSSGSNLLQLIREYRYRSSKKDKNKFS